MESAARMRILSLTWPIFLETLLRMLFMNVDVLMLSSYSDQAVAAVGLINQVGFFIIILLSMVSNGASVLIAQHHGAGQVASSRNVISSSVQMILGFSLLISMGTYFLARPVVGLYQLDADVMAYAVEYLEIYALFTLGLGLNVCFGAILKSYGFTKEAMYVNLFANGLNVLGNYLTLFGPFGLPVLGVQGVAYSTVISQSLAGVMLLCLVLRNKDLPWTLRDATLWSREHSRRILAIGIPSAGEVLSYNLTQIVILYFISQMGTASLSAYSYAIGVMRLIFLTAVSIGQALVILVGYHVGAGRTKEAYHSVNRCFGLSFGVSLALAGIVALLRDPIIAIFTEDPETAHMTSLLLIWAIVLEPGRTLNLIFINGLRGAGDVQYPVKIGILCMWGIAVVNSYLLGIVAGIGLLGVWIAFSMDEWIRGLVMMRRWRQRGWEANRLTT